MNAGDFKITFSVSGTEPNQMALFLNGTPVLGSVYGSGAGTQQNTGQVIVAVGASDVLNSPEPFFRGGRRASRRLIGGTAGECERLGDDREARLMGAPREVLLLAGLALSACGAAESPTILNTEKVERAIERSSLAQRGIRAVSELSIGRPPEEGLGVLLHGGR